jgi:hypothetical protein
MYTWRGKDGVEGISHGSFIKKKPKPLGLKLKAICDDETRVVLHMDMLEGAMRMIRKEYCNEHKATTAILHG